MKLKAIRRSVLALCLFAANAFAGYSHNFTWRQEPDPAALRNCIADMRRVIEARRSVLAGVDGEGPPVLDDLKVEINGIGDLAHEPFIFPGITGPWPDDDPDPQLKGFNSCKTWQKPYDAVVTACLMVARDYFPPSVLAITSSGSWDEGDWDEGARLYSSVFGKRARNPIAGGKQAESTVPNNKQLMRILLPIGAVLLLLYLRKNW
jgi:hypothetical protein